VVLYIKCILVFNFQLIILVLIIWLLIINNYVKLPAVARSRELVHQLQDDLDVILLARLEPHCAALILSAAHY
jgi:hypothetical protein